MKIAKERKVDDMLKDLFDAEHIDAAKEHFECMLEGLQKRDWERSSLKGGKFVEAVLKALWLHSGHSLPPDREFKAGKIMDDLERLPKLQHPDTVRITIPRACRFVYDIASNRGARHDPGEIDSNEMDANAVVQTCSWVMAEILRYSQKGSIEPSSVSSMVARLTQKKYPFIEAIDGRVYFHLEKKSARGVGLLTLWYAHPSRIPSGKLVEAIKGHGHSVNNARVAVSRLSGVVDDDGSGNLLLLAPGIKEAEDLFLGIRQTS